LSLNLPAGKEACQQPSHNGDEVFHEELDGNHCRMLPVFQKN
jgi:hypothetical protein